LTHCVLFRSMGARWENRDVPFWFEEGMATVAAGERHARASAEAVEAPARLVRTDPKLAYGTADRAFRLLVARHGDEGVRRLVAALSEGRPFSVAFGDAMGSPLAGFERDLRVELTALAARD
jgi:hypothetical protein